MSRLRLKLMLILVLFGVLLVALNLSIVHASFNYGFKNYLEKKMELQVSQLAIEVGELHEIPEAWNRLLEGPREWRRFLNRSSRRVLSLEQDLNSNEPQLRGEGRPPGPPPTLSSSPFDRIRLLDANKESVYRRGVRVDVSGDGSNVFVPVFSQSKKLIGYLTYPKNDKQVDQFEEVFLKQQTRFSLYTLLLSILLSALLAYFLASKLLRPVLSISQALRGFVNKDYKQKVLVSSNDELGELASDVNYLATALEVKDERQQQWMTDMAHELRTPLAVLKAQLEALQDGIRSFDESQLGLLMNQTQHLQRLVEDMRDLSASDVGMLNYQWDRVSLSDYFSAKQLLWQQSLMQENIEFSFTETGSPFEVKADVGRINQLMHNLLQNSLRYTDRPGRVKLSCHYDKDQLSIVWEDSSPGVPESEMEKIFDRLFKSDASRSLQNKSSGIGLAICKNIVEAHQGKISAEMSALGGLRIKIKLYKSFS